MRREPPTGPTTTHRVAFGRGRRLAGDPAPLKSAPGRLPRVVLQLALAHEIDRRLRVGELPDLATSPGERASPGPASRRSSACCSSPRTSRKRSSRSRHSREAATRCRSGPCAPSSPSRTGTPSVASGRVSGPRRTRHALPLPPDPDCCRAEGHPADHARSPPRPRHHLHRAGHRAPPRRDRGARMSAISSRRMASRGPEFTSAPPLRRAVGPPMSSCQRSSCRSCGGSGPSSATGARTCRPLPRSSAPSLDGGSRSAGFRRHGAPGRKSPASTGTTPSTACDTPPSRASTAPLGTSSWRSGSLGTRRP